MVLERIEQALVKLLQQARNNSVTLGMLPGDADVIIRMREVALVMQRVSPQAKVDTAAAGAELALRHITDSNTSPTMIRQEVFGGVLEILRDASGAPQVIIQRIGQWMRKFVFRGPALDDELSRKAHQSMLLLLFRGKMLQSTDVDLHFVANMDGGNNLLWVELALSVVRQCIVDGLQPHTTLPLPLMW